MCATTPALCPECDDYLMYVPGRLATCQNMHTTSMDKLPLPDGCTLATQYHAAGRSMVMLRTTCRRCQPVP